MMLRQKKSEAPTVTTAPLGPVDWRTDPRLVTAEARLTAAEHEVLRLESREGRLLETRRQLSEAIVAGLSRVPLGTATEEDVQRLVRERDAIERELPAARRAVETAAAEREALAAALPAVERAAKAAASEANERAKVVLIAKLAPLMHEAAALNVQLAAMMEGWADGSARPFPGLPITEYELNGPDASSYTHWAKDVRRFMESHAAASGRV